MQIKLSKFEDYIKLIKDYDLDNEQIKTLLTHGLGIFEDSIPSDREDLIKTLRDYWTKYGELSERPLFL